MRMFSTGRRRRWSPTRTALATVAGALLLTAAFAPASMAAAPTPNEGSATVDGAIGDWSLSADFFVDMTAAGIVGRPALAKLLAKFKDHPLVGEGEVFMLEVKGDSMIDAAICDGDWVVVRRQPVAESVQISSR